MGDLAISLGMAYQRALLENGAVPLILSATIQREVIAESVRRCDGVLLTGGEDLDPRLYASRLPTALRQKVHPTPDGGHRDLRELILVDEVFRQRKPLLAICRGHQVLNVALGGTLLSDLTTQRPRSLNHRQLERKTEIVHDVRLTPGSILARVTGSQTLGVNSTHHQAVARVAPLLQAVATSPDGVIEGLELRPEATPGFPFLLSVQFHPERLADRYEAHRALFRAFTEATRANRDLI